MLKQYVFAVCVGLASIGCASDELDPMLMGEPGFAGSSSMAGMDGVAGAQAPGNGSAAGSGDSRLNEAPVAGTSGASSVAGSGGDGTIAAGAGGTVDSAGAGSMVGAAGSGGSTAGTASAAGAAAGAPAMPCPDADGDGVCNADDKCPAGSDVDGDSNGYADACEKKLWEVKQSGDQLYTFAADIRPDSIWLSLANSGPGCTAAHVMASIPRGTAVAIHEVVTASGLASPATIAEAFTPCSGFTPSYWLPGMPASDIWTGPLASEMPHHVAYLRVDGVGTLLEKTRPRYGVTVDVTWTAYGY